MPLGMYDNIVYYHNTRKKQIEICKFFEKTKSAGALKNFRAFLQSFMEFVHALSAKT